jgi:hypothetical protein
LIAVLALVALLAIRAPQSCTPLVVPLAVTHQAEPVEGFPVLFDGAAVSVHCHF